MDDPQTTAMLIDKLSRDALQARKDGDGLKKEILQSTLARITNAEAVAPPQRHLCLLVLAPQKLLAASFPCKKYTNLSSKKLMNWLRRTKLWIRSQVIRTGVNLKAKLKFCRATSPQLFQVTSYSPKLRAPIVVQLVRGAGQRSTVAQTPEWLLYRHRYRQCLPVL